MKTHITFTFLILILLFCTSSCTNKSINADIELDGIYTLIRSEKRDTASFEAFMSINKGLTDKGVKLNAKTDFLLERQNEQPGEYEILIGPTNRVETESTLSEYALTNDEYLIKLCGNKIVILAGSENAYNLAAEWFIERYDVITGKLSIPREPYIGKRITVFEDFLIDNVSIDEFRIVADDIMGWELEQKAEMLRDRLFELCGSALTVVSDESIISTHEIILCSEYVNRELPDTDGECVYIHNGNLYLYGCTKEELHRLVDKFVATLLTEDSSNDITADSLSVINNKPEYTTEIITVAGDTPESRGAALHEAFVKADRLIKASAEMPKEIIIELTDGEYLITEPIEIGESRFSRLTVRAAKNTNPVITGAVAIPDSAWEKVEGKDYYRVQLDCQTPVRDIIVDFRNIPLASGNQYNTISDFENSYDKDDPANAKGLYIDLEAVKEMDELGYPTELLICQEYDFNRLHVYGVDMNDTKAIDGKEAVRVKLDEKELMEFVENIHGKKPLPNSEYRFENNIAFIVEDTCVCDYENNVIYYYPRSGVPKGVYYSVTDSLLIFSNTQNLSFSGITFTGTSCTTTAKIGYQLGQANTEKRGGVLECAAVLLKNCTNVDFVGCEFKGLGGNGIQSAGQLNGINVDSCVFDEISMSAIRLGNSSTRWEVGDSNYGFIINNNIR